MKDAVQYVNEKQCAMYGSHDRINIIFPCHIMLHGTLSPTKIHRPEIF